MTQHVEVGGLSIAFERTGTGPAVALAHGFVGDARSTWGRQIEALSDRFTVVAWTAPLGGINTRHGWIVGNRVLVAVDTSLRRRLSDGLHGSPATSSSSYVPAAPTTPS